MTKILASVNSALWGAPVLLLILGVGIFLSLRLGFVQIRLFPRAVRSFVRKLRPEKNRGEQVTSFQALCTALSATVGTGNLVGVAGAICLGGPGAVFWMWLCALFGMAVKYTEAVLAVRFRENTAEGFAAGPMYVIRKGLGQRFLPLAKLYCLFGILATFGVGNAAQVNAVVTGVQAVTAEWRPIPGIAVGFVLALLLGPVLLGGAKRIAAAAERLIPFAAAGYILLCCGVLAAHAPAVPQALCAIVRGAFDPKAVTGGMLGSAFQALRIGCSRGVFTNEAGMGTASIAHGCADVAHPGEQGLMGIMEVFLDTIVICTMTALAILVSGVPIPYGVDAGGELTLQAFSGVYGKTAAWIITAALCLFASATVLGWGLYGARCAEFLFGKDIWKIFSALQILVIVFSSVMDTASVWLLSETVNGLMAIPNLITLALLAPEAARLTREYTKSDEISVSGGNYADFHQCQPLRTLSHEKVPPSCHGSQERGQKDLPPEHRPARSAYS